MKELDHRKIIKDLVASRKSYININEANLIYKMACQSEGLIVEIGTRLAGTTCILGLSKWEKSERVYSIDINRREEAQSLLDRYKLSCNLLTANSVIYAPKWDKGRISMLFVDGNHDTDHAYHDITLWEEHLKVGGYMCVHDFPFKFNVKRAEKRAKKRGLEHMPQLTVYRAVTRFLNKYDNFRIVKHIPSTIVLEKMHS